MCKIKMFGCYDPLKPEYSKIAENNGFKLRIYHNEAEAKQVSSSDVVICTTSIVPHKVLRTLKSTKAKIVYMNNHSKEEFEKTVAILKKVGQVKAKIKQSKSKTSNGLSGFVICTYIIAFLGCNVILFYKSIAKKTKPLEFSLVVFLNTKKRSINRAFCIIKIS